MKTTKNRRRVKTRWDATAAEWVRGGGFPYGTKLKLIRRRDRRQVRGDFIVHRESPMATPDRDDTVAAALQELTHSFITDIGQRGLYLELVGPHDYVVPGNTLVRSVLAYEAEVDPTREAQDEYWRSIFASIARQDLDLAQRQGNGLEALLRGYARAFLERFAFEDIKAAFTTEHAEAAR